MLLDKWLGDRLSSYGQGIANGCLEFLAKKVSQDLGQQTDGPASNTLTAAEPSTISLSAPTVSIFIQIIRHHHESLSVEELERFKEVRTQAVQLHPKLMNFLPGNEDEPGTQLSSFDSPTEAEIAVRYVLDAIQHPSESKWYAFGSQALARFQTRLEEWPQLAAAVSETAGTGRAIVCVVNSTVPEVINNTAFAIPTTVDWNDTISGPCVDLDPSTLTPLISKAACTNVIGRSLEKRPGVACKPACRQARLTPSRRQTYGLSIDRRSLQRVWPPSDSQTGRPSGRPNPPVVYQNLAFHFAP
ncbi:hypothetical protein DFH28DRAFT_1202829 [Melampsora americana]|nr:hypothetical protein DFH28DRAFT_1202829 [Melampsora americana]